MELARHHIRIIHVHNSVLYRVVVLIKYIFYCLLACLILSACCAAGVFILSDYLSNTCESHIIHRVLYRLSNQ